MHGQVSGTSLADATPWDSSGTVGEALLAPTSIYVRRLLSLMGAADVKVCMPAVPTCWCCLGPFPVCMPAASRHCCFRLGLCWGACGGRRRAQLRA